MSTPINGGSPGHPTGSGAATQSDEILLARVAQGDSGAFETFHDRWTTRVYSVVRCLVADAVTAEAVALEVWVRVWRTAPSYDAAHGGAAEWLLAEAHRAAVERLRSPGGRDADRPTGVHREWKGARALTEEQRRTLSVTYHEGRTCREAGVALGVEPRTVKRRLREGVHRMLASPEFAR